MCTLILLRRPGHAWPLLVAANRDELKSRPWRAPARHWPDRPEVVAGIDEESGGSWLGVNDHGVVAAVLNRVGTLGPQPGKRSRGELVLDALDHIEAEAAAEVLAAVDPEAYRPFNLIIADRHEAYWLRHAGTLPDFGFRTAEGGWRAVDPILLPHHTPGGARSTSEVECHPIPEGLSMITARDLNDPASPRLRHYLGRFEAAEVPDPARDAWGAWIELLGDHEGPDGDPKNALNIVTASDYGTVCASLIAVPEEGPPRMLFAPGRPDVAPFEVIDV